MKILLSAFACAPNRGSEPGVGWNWAKVLSKNNEVYVITREENRKEIEAYRQEHTIPFHVEYFGISFFEEHTDIPFQKNLYTMVWQKKVVAFASRLHDKYHFDICHHITYASFKYPTRLYQLGIPLIVGPVGGGEVTPESCKQTYGLKDRIFEFIHDLQITLTVHKKQFTRMCENAAIILTTTQETYDCIPDTYKSKTEIMQTIGVAKSEIEGAFTRREYEEGKSFKVLYAGNLLPLKGVCLLPEIAKRIEDKCVVFQIIGDGPEKAKMQQRIAEYGLSERFTFMGCVDRTKVLEYMDDAHLFIFPSFHDSGAMVLLEAMARKLPVLVLATGGPGVHVKNGNGFRVEPKQSLVNIVEDFAKCIQRCKQDYLTSRETIDEMVDKAEEYLYSQCVWEKKAEIMQEIYQKALEENRK